jgi:WD40 repeat protein
MMPIAMPSVPIGPDNAGEVRGLTRWGTGYIDQVAYSPDGQTLAAASSLGIYLCDIPALAFPQLIETQAIVRSVAFSPDGSTLAAGMDDGTIRRWGTAAGGELPTLAGHSRFITRIAYSPDGVHLASASRDGKVILRETAGVGTIRETWTIPQGWAANLAFSPDGKILSVRTIDQHAQYANESTVILWSTDNGEELITLSGIGYSESDIVFSPDGKFIVFGTSRGVKTFAIGAKYAKDLPIKGSADASVFAFSPDGKLLAGGPAEDGTVRIWDTATWREARALPIRSVGSLAFSPDGKMLASGQMHALALWDADSGKEIRTVEFTLEPRSPAFLPDGRTIAYISGTAPILLRDAFSGEMMKTLAADANASILTVSPDGKMIATGSGDGTVAFWDIASGTARYVRKAHGNIVTSVAFSPDGKRLVSASWDGYVRIRDALTGEEILAIPPADDDRDAAIFPAPASAVFSPSGNLIAAGLMDNRVRIWSAITGAIFRTMIQGEPYYGEGAYAAFSPDGKTLASGSSKQSIKLWDPISAKELHTLAVSDLGCMAFSPDGKILAFGSGRRLFLLNVAEWEVTRILENHNGSISGIAFSPDGRILVTSSTDGTLRIWGVSP